MIKQHYSKIITFALKNKLEKPHHTGIEMNRTICIYPAYFSLFSHFILLHIITLIFVHPPIRTTPTHYSPPPPTTQIRYCFSRSPRHPKPSGALQSGRSTRTQTNCQQCGFLLWCRASGQTRSV